MKIAMQCVNKKKLHEFELEVSKDLAEQLRIRGIKEISGVICPNCKAEQVMELPPPKGKEKDSEVPRVIGRKPETDLKKRKAQKPDPAFERGVGGAS